MAYWFIFSLILLLADSLKLISFVAEASQFLHGVCVQHAQYQEYADAVAAIVCGATPKASTLVQDIKRTGLYHVMVVSGAHLTFLAAVLTAGRQRWHRHTLPLLFVYLLTCNMQAPALRAYLFLGLSKLAVERRWNWTPADLVLVAGLAAGLLRHEFGLSLYLSWTTSLILALSGHAFFRQTLLFIVVQIALCEIATMHPLTIWSNLLLAPIMGTLLFPMSLFALLFPWAKPLSDGTWRYLESFLLKLSPDFFIPALTVESPGWAWLALICAHAILLTLPNWKRRWRTGA